MDEFLGLERRAKVDRECTALLAPSKVPFTYSSLWQEVSEARRQLGEAGLVKGHPVSIVLPDGPEFLTTLLAVGAFGPCAPLDSNASQQEYQFYFSRLRSPSLVTWEGCSAAAVASAKALGMRIFELDPFRASGEVEPDFEPRESNASLLLFTSSTTGRPKLVPLTSTNVEVSCRDEARALQLTNNDRLLNLTPNFTLRGLRAALTQLCRGGSVVCARRFHPHSFPGLIEEFRPTWVSVSAAGLAALCSLSRQIPGLWRDSGVRFIRSGGTAPDPQLVRDLEALSGVPVLDGYGTTETGCVTRAVAQYRKPGSVGRSTGTQIAILEESGKAAAAGTVGEIAVRGPNVTSEYLDDDEANQRTFQGGWFHSRDLGRMDEDGFLFLAGRIDDVINRGGQKIIPQEVEAALKEHAGVREAAVFGVAHKTLGEEIVAAVVLHSRAVFENELRSFVASRLAEYKVPSSILYTEELPRNAAGKLQRKMLSAMYGQIAQAVEAPVTETERVLATMWAEELNLASDHGPVGRDAHFSRMGGDSLTASLVATRIQAEFGVLIDLRAFKEYPRLRDFAWFVDERMQSGNESLEVLEYTSRDQPFPLSFAQERTLKYMVPIPGNSGRLSVTHNMAFAHSLRGPLDVEVLRRGMVHLAERHEILRTTCGLTTQSVHPQAVGELSVIDLSHLPEPSRRAGELLQEEATKPFDLEALPLVRFVLARLGPEEHWLLRVNHHIISDAHSWKIYFQELGRVYEELLEGRTPQTAEEKRADYGDYVLWQRRQLSPERPAFREAIEWWISRLTKVSERGGASLHECINRAAQPVSADLFEQLPGLPDASRGVLAWGLDPATSARLHQLQIAEGVTFFEVRMAAFAVLLADITGQSETVIGTPFSYRNRREWQNVMGDFGNLVTIPLRPDAGATFREFVRTVNRDSTATSAYGEVPYELLCSELRARGVIPPEIHVMFYAAEQTSAMQFGEVEMTWSVERRP
jgi:acyl-coenzyme A synthetase/AMP-(fatty) acid ligase